MASEPNQKAQLIHEIGKESRIVIKGDRDVIDETDFFFSQYKQAATIVRNYGRYNSGESDFENHNNIVAFIGERGSGKTSCMMSFANWLCGKVESAPLEKVWVDNKGERRNEPGAFLQLPVIDPSFFSKSYNIVGSLLASLYEDYKRIRECQNRDTNLRPGKVNDFLEALSKAQHSFSLLNADGKGSGDSIEQLEGLSCTLRLKHELYKLVDCYLQFNNAAENSKLVICIDDIDLNTSSAVDMMEWIRKYLIQPNVVILMAIKLDQMTNLKRLSLVKEYRELLEKERMPEYEIDEMAERYISKLIPLAHRVYLPSEIDIPLLYYVQKDPVKGDTNSGVFRDVIVKEIFKKTKYLFYNSPNRTNLIVPRNLREALHLMRELYDMEDYDGDLSLSESIRIKNQSAFKEYLYNDFIDNNLNSKSRGYVEELLSVYDATQYNAEVLSVLKMKFPEVLNPYLTAKCEFGKEEPLDKEIWHIFNSTNMSHNISMGDVLWILDWLDNMERSVEESYFLFVVRTFYSMQLSDYYYQFINAGESKGSGSLLIGYTKSEIENKEDFLLLQAGQVFNPKLVDFIPESKSDSQKYISNGKIDLKKIKDSKLEEKHPKLLELLMLCTARPIERKLSDEQYRKNSSPRYAVPFAPNSQKAIFDVYSFFYNILDIKTCYEKYNNVVGANVIRDILKSEDSLWFSMYKESGALEGKALSSDSNPDGQKNDGGRKADIVSDLQVLKNWRKKVCIRNAEGYQHFANYLEGKRRSSDGLKLEEKIKGFFHSVFGYTITRDSENKGFDFCFLENTILAKLIDEQGKNIIRYVSDNAEGDNAESTNDETQGENDNSGIGVDGNKKKGQGNTKPRKRGQSTKAKNGQASEDAIEIDNKETDESGNEENENAVSANENGDSEKGNALNEGEKR